MDDSGVYNSTTVSYDGPNGVSMSGDRGAGGGGGRRPWNLSEIVSPPANRSRWFHWLLLMGGSITLGLGLIVVVIGIYNQHYYDPESKNVTLDKDETPPSHWVVTLIGFCFVILGLFLLVIYCKMMNNFGRTPGTNNRFFLCNPLTRMRQVVTKPRYQMGRKGSRAANLLSGDGTSINPMVNPHYNYNPVQNGKVISEEKANLMANEVKEGFDDIPSSEALLTESGGTTPSTQSSSRQDPRIVLHPFAKA